MPPSPPRARPSHRSARRPHRVAWRGVAWQCAVLATTIVRCLAATPAAADPPAPADLASLLGPIREQHGLPALAVAVVEGERLVATGAVGVRKLGDPTPVTVADRFHVGSCTKSMTATLAALLVEERRLSWTQTLAATFPERAEAMHPDYRSVTLEQLLSHRGGAPAELHADGLWQKLWQHRGTPTEQRLALLDGVTRKPPAVPPGTEYRYANAGYALAGAMIERATGQAWEPLLRQRLFAPLQMTSAGFGAPASPERVDQPWGHRSASSGLRPVPPGPGADNPAAIGPGGTVHCSILDLARYAAFHVQGARGAGRLLETASFRQLHTPVAGQDYALGWRVVKRDWAGGVALTHTGSNTMFFAVMWLAPERDFAVVVATNLGGSTAEQACDQAAAAAIRWHRHRAPAR